MKHRRKDLWDCILVVRRLGSEDEAMIALEEFEGAGWRSQVNMEVF